MLNSVSEGVTAHTHPVPDTDTYFVIDPITRKIENTNRKKNVIMQYDHNSERFTFELPRYIDGHDMLECTSVTVNVDNIETGVEEPRVNSDAPDITDLRVHPNDPEKVISSWLISRNSTKLAGILSFHIEYKCVDSNGNVVYEWSTDAYDEIEIRARKKNGEAAVSEYTDVLEQWRASIFGAGDSVMANIAAEGEAQIAAVKVESEAQQEAVELKGTQTLDSIPEDYTEVDAMADDAVRSKADAIVCESSGESIVLKDSSDDHIRGLKLFGKSTQVTTTGVQLLDFDTEQHFTASNGYITLMKDVNPFTKGAGTYTFNCTGTIGNTYRLWVYEKDSNNSLIVNVLAGDKFDLTEEQIASVKNICIAASGFEVGTTYKGSIYPTISYGSESHDYEPYTGGKPSPNPEYPQAITSVENSLVGIYGKNLIDVDAIEGVMNKKVSVSPDKYTLTVTGGMGKSYSYSYYNMPIDLVRLLEGKPLRLSIDSTTKTVANAYCPVQLNISTSDKTTIYPVCHGGRLQHDFVMPRNVVECKIGVYTNNASTPLDVDNTVVFNGLRLTLQDTPEYEPYKPYQTITLPRSILGIPVTSGGNYTDSDGQQWICDEIDLERGALVQRVKIETFDGNNSGQWWEYFSPGYEGYARTVPDMRSGVRWAGYSNMFRVHTGSSFDPGIWIGADNNVLYLHNVITLFPSLDYFKEWVSSNPFTVMYPLATPIETPLTAEEITAFKALRTNYPNTTILNDAGAWMNVKYNADTKTYVENPKTLKLVDSSTGLVYELKIVDGELTVVQV